MNLMRLERVSSVEEALALAPEMGIPAPECDGRRSRGAHRLDDLRPHPGRYRSGPRAHRRLDDSREHPRIVDPPAGRLWTANARVAADPRQLELIGGHVASLGSEYDLGARAGQIRDDLMALQGSVKPADMLQIQLDDRAKFLARWRACCCRCSMKRACRLPRSAPSSGAAGRLERACECRLRRLPPGAHLPRPRRDALWRILGALAVAADEDGAAGTIRRPAVAVADDAAAAHAAAAFRELARISARAGGCHARQLAASCRSLRAAPGGHATSCASAIRCRARCLASRAFSTCRC